MLKKFSEFDNVNEAFEPKKVKERTVKNFVKRCLKTAGSLEGLSDYYDMMSDNSKDFEKADILSLSKQLEQYQPQNIYEVGALAMMKYYLTNYFALNDSRDASGMPTLTAFKKMVEQGSGYKFKGTAPTQQEIDENGFGFIELETIEEELGFKPEQCKFYELHRETNDRSELCQINAVITPKGAYMDLGSDKVSGSSEWIIPFKDIPSYIKNNWV